MAKSWRKLLTTLEGAPVFVIIRRSSKVNYAGKRAHLCIWPSRFVE